MSAPRARPRRPWRATGASAARRALRPFLRARWLRRTASASLLCLAPPLLAAQGIPGRLSDQQFWQMVTNMSEEGGFFRSDNFVSNEMTYQDVIPELVRGRAPGGVYMGVGPDQNFTYIVAMRPRIAFIVDIRRGALHQHLMYKALIEMSADRAEFLSLLFSRPRPKGLSRTSTATELFQAYYLASADSATYWRNLRAIKDRLTKVHGFTLDAEDFAGIEYVYTSFYLAGPDISYSFGSGRGGFGLRGMPSYAQLMEATDAQGRNRGYLATEENFAVLKDLTSRNLVVPLVGDFAGPKAIRAVGQYVRDHGATVTAIYTSNVEQYLFQGADDWQRYYTSVGTLPLDSLSTFVRAVFNYGVPRSPGGGYGPRSTTLLCSVQELLGRFRAGRITSYWDVVGMSR
jgi:hypothetical protein